MRISSSLLLVRRERTQKKRPAEEGKRTGACEKERGHVRCRILMAAREGKDMNKWAGIQMRVLRMVQAKPIPLTSPLVLLLYRKHENSP